MGVNARLENRNSISVEGSIYLYTIVVCPPSHPEQTDLFGKQDSPDGRLSALSAVYHEMSRPHLCGVGGAMDVLLSVS